jgi:hypothetical protein
VSGQEEPDLRTGLADIDRRLRALQDELASADAPPAPDLPREADPPREVSDRAAEDLALAIIARAEEQAGRIVEAAHDRVVALNTQAVELMHLRDALRRSARELLAEFDTALRRLESSFGDARPPAPALQASDGAPASAPPAAPATGTQVGVVSLTVEPFADVGDLASFTAALQQLPGAEQVTVDSFDGRRAAIALQLGEPVELERELHRVIPLAMEIGLEEEGAISIMLDSSRPSAPS